MNKMLRNLTELQSNLKRIRVMYHHYASPFNYCQQTARIRSHSNPFNSPKRLLSSNPMFPDRQTVIPAAAAATTNKKGSEPDDDSFLGRHGGKVALFGFGISALLIYSYFLGLKNKRLVDEDICNRAGIEPYEIIEIRDRNGITMEEFEDIAYGCYERYHEKEITYPEFIR